MTLTWSRQRFERHRTPSHTISNHHTLSHIPVVGCPRHGHRRAQKSSRLHVCCLGWSRSGHIVLSYQPRSPSGYVNIIRGLMQMSGWHRSADASVVRFSQDLRSVKVNDLRSPKCALLTDVRGVHVHSSCHLSGPHCLSNHESLPPLFRPTGQQPDLRPPSILTQRSSLQRL